MSTPPPLPSGPPFFLDRSVGRIAVPQGLRAAGVDLVTLAERYGVPQDEQIDDERWMREAAENDEAVLMCDDAIRKRNPQERQILISVKLRAFVINPQLTAEQVVRRFLTNRPAIERACQHPGPFVYRIHPNRIERRRLSS